MRLKTKQILLLNTVIGLMDTLTGILLMISPVIVLKLLFIPEIPIETIYLRFIGAFVCAVGSTYLISALYFRDTNYLIYVKGLWAFTGLIRLTIGSFLVITVSLGLLHFLWLTVALADLSIAILQFYLISKHRL